MTRVVRLLEPMFDRIGTAPNRVVEHSPGPNPTRSITAIGGAEMHSTRRCSVDGCDRPFSAKGMCNLHYQRAIKGKPLIQPERVVRESCTVAGCSAAPRSKFATMCEKHYARWYRTGSTVARPIRTARGVCSVQGCGMPDHGPHGLCAKHKMRVRRHGDPGVVKVPSVRSGEDHANWAGDEVSYHGMHMRLRAGRGPASAHRCSECGGQAKQWAYNHADPRERASEWGPYSTDMANYDPKCIPCHKRADLARIAGES